MVERQIASLPCWNGETTLDELSGGITNRNYVVEDGDRRYVARLCTPLPHLGIHRLNEVACQKFAAGLGLAPAIHYHQDTILVSDFVRATTLTAYRGECVDSDLRDLNILKAVSLLREALWSFIQTKKSDLEFDYEKYANDNLQAYHAARQTM